MAPAPPSTIRCLKVVVALVKRRVGSPAAVPAALYWTTRARRSDVPLLPPGTVTETTSAPGVSAQSTDVSHSGVMCEPEMGTSPRSWTAGGRTFSARPRAPTMTALPARCSLAFMTVLQPGDYLRRDGTGGSPTERSDQAG